MQFQIQFVHESPENILKSKNVWSKAHKVDSIAKKMPLNMTTFVHHGVSYSVIEREEEKMFPKTYNINIKTPVVVVNCLPLVLDFRITKLDYLNDGEEDQLKINVGETQYLHCYNLKDPVVFSICPLSKPPSTQKLASAQVSLTQADFIGEQVLKINSSLPSSVGVLPAEIMMKTVKDQHAGLKIIFYSAHVLINNTDINFAYQYDKLKGVCGADQSDYDNIVLISNVSTHIMTFLETQVASSDYSEGWSQEHDKPFHHRYRWNINLTFC